MSRCYQKQTKIAISFDIAKFERLFRLITTIFEEIFSIGGRYG